MQKALNILGAFSMALTDNVRSSVNRELGAGGETAAALIMIGPHPGLSMGELARALAISYSGAGRLMDRLEAEGLVVREASEGDHRSVVVKLTEAGEAKRVKMLAQREKALCDATTRLSPEEIETLGALLGKALGGMLTERDGQCYRLCRMCDESSCVPSVCPVEAQWALMFGGDGERARKP